MKLRTIIFKVRDLEKSLQFWQQFLNQTPRTIEQNQWIEFRLGDSRLGLSVVKEGETFSGSNCTPVFEYTDMEIHYYIDKAKSLGAEVVYEGLSDPKVKGVILRDPVGNEFELSRVQS